MVKKESELSFKVKKTTELSVQEVEQLVALIYSTMNVTKTTTSYKDKYIHNFLGFSFHALMFEKNKIVGCNTVIPQEFNYFGKKYLFGQWCETLIDKNYRGAIFNFKRLGNILNDVLLKNDICFIYGLPNKALYIVSKRLLGMRDIGKLNYYTYPVSLKRFLIKYYPLNIIFNFFIKIYLKIKINFIDQNNFPISKINNDNFKNGRYFKSNKYKFLKKENYEAIYFFDVSKKHNSAKIIWVLDVHPLSKSNLEKTINELKKAQSDSNNLDMIIYIGCLKTVPYNMLKIPSKFVEENNIFSGKILDYKKIDEKIFNHNLWNVNSSNFDYR